MKIISSLEELQDKIDDLEQTVMLLRNGEARLRHLTETIPEGIIIFDQAGKVTFINKALEKMLGLGRSQIVGCCCKELPWYFLPQEGTCYREDVNTIIGDIIKTGRSVTGKECVLGINGGRSLTLSIHAAPYHDDSGNIAGVSAAFYDITAFARARDEATEIQDIYKKLTSYADDAIFRTRIDDGKIVYINEAAEKILGYSLADYLTDTDLYAKFVLPEYFPAWLRVLAEIKGGKDYVKNVVLGITAKDGRTVMMEFAAVAAREHSGKPVYLEALGRDITERRFMEKELAKAQKLEAIGLLAGGIAHDFNKILTAILGSISLAKIEAKSPDMLSERLARAEEHCIKAKALTKRLLTYSRGGSLLRKTSSLAKILQDAANFAVSGKNVRCTFNFTEGLWAAQIDEGQMQQVVHYLVNNAAEAMPDGGIIEIGAQNETIGATQSSPLLAGNYVKWYVKDHGVGIPATHMKKLFDPYFTTKQLGNIKGMGLGLAICYSIIKNHEGLINVHSIPGAGTVFTVYIPAVGEEDGKDRLKKERKVKTKDQRKILLIDDEQILLDVTSRMLVHLGYEVVTAQHHEDALDIYGKAKKSGHPFSLIFIDLTMRGDVGGEMAIRKWLAAYPEVKAIISSGYVNDPVIEEYWRYGFAGAIIKPYALNDLEKVLDKVMTKNNN